MNITESQLRKVIRERLSSYMLLEGSTESGWTTDALIDQGIISEEHKDGSEVIFDATREYAEKVRMTDIATGLPVDYIDIVASSLVIAANHSPAKAARFLAIESGKNYIEGEVISGVVGALKTSVTSTALLGGILALTFMVPAVFYYEIKRMEKPDEVLKGMQSKFYVGRDKKPPLGWDKLDKPIGGSVHPNDVEKNPLYKIIQDSLINNNTNMSRALHADGVITKDVEAYLNAPFNQRKALKSLVAVTLAVKSLGPEKAERLMKKKDVRPKKDHQSQLKSLSQKVRGEYDRSMKRRLWDYSAKKPHPDVTEQHRNEFIQSVARLKKFANDQGIDLSLLKSALDDTFKSENWKGSRGSKDHTGWYSDGLAGVLNQQLKARGGTNRKRLCAMRNNFLKMMGLSAPGCQ